MNIEQWAGFIVSAISIAVAFVGSVRWLVKLLIESNDKPKRTRKSM